MIYILVLSLPLAFILGFAIGWVVGYRNAHSDRKKTLSDPESQYNALKKQKLDSL